MKKTMIALLLCAAIAGTGSGCIGQKTAERSEAPANAGQSAENAEAAEPTAESTKTAAGAKVIKVALTTAETHSCNRSFEKFKEVLEEVSGGAFSVEIYPNSQLGNDRESVEDVQLGNVTMTNISSAIVAQFVPSLGVFDLPFLFPNREYAQAMFDDPSIGGVLETDMASAGFQCLGFWDAGYRHLTNSKKEIRTPGDLSGMKIRTMSSPYHIAAWELYGASPTPIAFTELFTALQQKTVDGQENPYGLIVSQKFYEVQPYLSATGHILTVTPLLMNKEFYDSLTEEEQGWIQEAAKQSTAYNRDIAKQEEDCKQQILDASVQVYEMTEEERNAFKEKATPVYEQMKEEINPDLIDAILQF